MEETPPPAGASKNVCTNEDIDEVDTNGDTCIHRALIYSKAYDTDTYESYNAYIKHVIERNMNCLNSKNNCLQTPLIVAVILGYCDVVYMLLDLGVDKMCQDKRSMSALHHAVEKNHLEIAKLLIRSPHCYNTLDEVTKLMAVYDEHGRNCMHLATFFCRYDMLTVFYQYGAQLNCRMMKTGDGLLHIAVHIDDEFMLKFLLTILRVNPHRGNWNNVSPLSLACSYRRLELCKIMFESDLVDMTDMFVPDADRDMPIEMVYNFDECVVCWETTPTVTLHQCKHKCLCSQCCGILLSNAKVTCPICREISTISYTELISL